MEPVVAAFDNQRAQDLARMIAKSVQMRAKPTRQRERQQWAHAAHQAGLDAVRKAA
jgi:hypothetical protein